MTLLDLILVIVGSLVLSAITFPFSGLANVSNENVATPEPPVPDAWGVLCHEKLLTGVITHSEETAQQWIDRHAVHKDQCRPVPLYVGE